MSRLKNSSQRYSGNRCWAVTANFNLCKRRGSWKFLCHEHRRTKYLVRLFVAFALALGVVGSIASIQSGWFSHVANPNAPSTDVDGNRKVALKMIPDKFGVLVAEFEGPDPQKYGVTNIILEQLIDATQDYQYVEIKRLNQNIDTSEVAQAKGREAQADIVLWGTYVTNTSHTRVTTHFEVIDKSFDLPLRKEKEIITARTAELESFTMQEQLSKGMTYLVLLTVGIIQLESLHFDEAVASFTKALSLLTVPEQIIEPHHLYDYRAICYLMKGMPEEAVADYSKAISFKRDADLFYMRGFIYVRQAKLTQALVDLNISLSLEPREAVYAMRGFAYLYLAHDLRHAMLDFNKAIELNPNSIGGRVNRSMLYSQEGNFEAALADVNVVIGLQPSSGAYGNRGTIFSAKGDTEKALADYSIAIELDPNNATNYYNRGNLNSRLHNLDEALADLNSAIRIYPQFASAYSERGNIYRDRGMLDEAILDYSTAIERPDDEAYGTYYNRGAVFHLKGEFDRAIQDYDQSIRLNSQFADSYGNRCNTYLRKKNFDRAISDCNRAIKLNPNNHMYYTSRGAALASMRHFTRAIEDFERAIELDGKDIKAYSNRGNVYFEQGKKSDAVADLRKVIEIGGDDSLVLLAKRNLCALGVASC